MGLLVEGKPLTWQQTKRLQQYIKYHGLLQFINLWKSLKSQECDQLYWGDEIECLLLSIDPTTSNITLKLRAAEILEDLQQKQEAHELNRPGSSWNVLFHPEYGNFMLEVTPNVPYGNTTRDLRLVESNHRLRRALLQSALDDNEVVLFLSNFPYFGNGTFTNPPQLPRGPILKSSYVPDHVMAPHPRFATLSGNIRRRRGRRVNITMPLYKDEFTLDDASGNIPPIDEIEPLQPSNDVIHMDAMGFGMGQCCLQVTFQARSIDEARFLYDQLAVISPIFLALTANTPFHRGRVADTDARWNVISQAVDDRTYTEMGFSDDELQQYIPSQQQRIAKELPPSPQFKPQDLPLVTKEDGTTFDDDELTPLDDLQQTFTAEGVFESFTDEQPTVGVPYEHGETPRIYKSRYSSIDCYISNNNPHYKTEFNDVLFPYNRLMYTLLRKEGVDELLAKHMASLFVRDSLVTFEGQIELDDMSNANHFESIQSSNWRSVRFKPPPIHSDIGWRVEFRTMELQTTDFENAAFTVFLALLTRAITYFHLNFYMPLSLVDTNFETAHRNDAVRKEKFYFKSCIPFDNKPCPKQQRIQLEAGCEQWERTEEITSRPCRDQGQQQQQLDGDNHHAPQHHLHDTHDDDLQADYVEMSIAEIMCGSAYVSAHCGADHVKGTFIGLVPIVKQYLTRIRCDEDTLTVVNRYLLLIEKRAMGELLTGAQWMRQFLAHHPSYKHDSIIPSDALYDLCIFNNALGNSNVIAPDLIGNLDPSIDYDGQQPPHHHYHPAPATTTTITTHSDSQQHVTTTADDNCTGVTAVTTVATVTNISMSYDILYSHESSNSEKLRSIIDKEVTRILSTGSSHPDSGVIPSAHDTTAHPLDIANADLCTVECTSALSSSLSASPYITTASVNGVSGTLSSGLLLPSSQIPTAATATATAASGSSSATASAAVATIGSSQREVVQYHPLFMNFLWGRKSDSSRVTRVRKDELDQLRRTQRDLHWMTDDTFEKTINAQHLVVRISVHVPSAFPSSPPVVRLLSPATHPWVDNQGYFSCSPIVTNWRPESPSLVTMLNTIVAKFAEVPPIPASSQYQQPYSPSGGPQPGQQPTQPSPGTGYNPYNPYQPGGPTPTSTTFVPGQATPTYQHNGMQPPYGQQGGMPSQYQHHQQQQQHMNQSPRSGSTTPRLVPPKQNHLKVSTYTRPSTPPLPPEPTVDVCVVPPEPSLDRNTLNSLTLDELTELDNSQDKVKTYVLSHTAILQQMYESQLRVEGEIAMLKDQHDALQQQHAELTPEYKELQTSLDEKEQELKTLRDKYNELSQQFSVYNVIKEIQAIRNNIETQCDDLITQFSSQRNVDEEKLAEFLSKYHKLRQRWHYHDIIVTKLRETYTSR